MSVADNIVLVLPFYGGIRRHMSFSTETNPVLRSMTFCVEALNKDFKILFPYPSNKEEQFFEEYSLLDNVEYIPMKMIYPEFVDTAMLTEEFYNLFNQYTGKYQYDAVINFKSINCLFVERVVTAPKWLPMYNSRIPIPFIQAPYAGVNVKTAHRVGGGCLNIDSEIEVLSYLSNYNYFFHSPSELDLVREELFKIAQPHAIKRFLRSSLALGTLDVEYTKRKMEPFLYKNRDIDILFAGRVVGPKNTAMTATIMDKLIAMRGFNCVITTHMANCEELENIRRRGSSIDIFVEQPFDAYLDRLCRSKVFLFLSRWESFCYTLFEAVLAGCVPVVLDVPWNRNLIPDDYPYRVSSIEEGIAVVDTILSDEDEYNLALSEVAKLQDIVKTNFDLPAFYSKFNSYVTGIMKRELGKNAKRSGGLFDVMQSVFDANDSLDEFEAKTRAEATNSNVFIPRAKLRNAYKLFRGDYD